MQLIKRSSTGDRLVVGSTLVPLLQRQSHQGGGGGGRGGDKRDYRKQTAQTPCEVQFRSPLFNNHSCSICCFFPPFSPSYVISGIKSASADTEKKQKCVLHPQQNMEHCINSQKTHRLRIFISFVESLVLNKTKPTLYSHIFGLLKLLSLIIFLIIRTIYHLNLTFYHIPMQPDLVYDSNESTRIQSLHIGRLSSKMGRGALQQQWLPGSPLH